MTRSDLIRKLGERSNLNLSTAEMVIHETFSAMAKTLKSGGRIEIRGFGSFEVRGYDGYNGRNPLTGQEVIVKSKKLPFFKVGKELKERIKT